MRIKADKSPPVAPQCPYGEQGPSERIGPEARGGPHPERQVDAQGQQGVPADQEHGGGGAGRSASSPS
ncbi:hypothetical protein OG884_12825 [Streptosporangium sp. NBC_01755]|uniref:hypothetical protein n=1 Tax=unclassified Streptosporangium TaxID=2632669 RepID=UPI002DD9B451|nr:MULTISPECIES: hypothetical protein [unclassified Streptosporangium]WSA25870.1 hypothetical protein OIE13_34030 [Streptosporangium sp. NBC_01810]WSD02737.1 hypothetical protein OG884_12825 [Streptosporangium sp. NBC_01755]